MTFLILPLFLEIMHQFEKSEGAYVENSIFWELLFERELTSRSRIRLLELDNADGIFVMYDSTLEDKKEQVILTKFNLDGESVWKIAISNEFWNNSITVDDFNGDNYADFILLSGVNRSSYDTVVTLIFLIDGKTGKLTSRTLPSWSFHPWFLLSDRLVDIKNSKRKGIIHLEMNTDARLISLASAKLLWEKKLLSEQEYKEVVPFDIIPSPSHPVVCKMRKQQLLYITFEPYIWCLDANQGITIWSNREGNFKFTGEPIFLEHLDDSLSLIISSGILSEDIFGYKKIAIYAYNALKGTIAWKQYLGEYFSNETPIIKPSHYNNIPLLIVAIKGGNDVFLIESKIGQIISKQRLPFLVHTFSVDKKIDCDVSPDVVFLGKAKRTFRDEQEFEAGVFIYSIVEQPLKRKLVAKDGKYELIPDYLKTPEDIHRQLHESYIPWLVLKNYFSFEDAFRSGYSKDIDGDGAMEVVMLSPPSAKGQKLHALRIIPITKKY